MAASYRLYADFIWDLGKHKIFYPAGAQHRTHRVGRSNAGVAKRYDQHASAKLHSHGKSQGAATLEDFAASHPQAFIIYFDYIAWHSNWKTHWGRRDY